MIGLVLALAAPAAGVDLPYTQDFEADLAALTAEGWAVGSATIVPSDPASGKQCLRVQSTDGKPAYAHLFIPVEQGRFYAAEASIRCEAVEPHASGSQNRGAVVFLQWATPERSWIGGGSFPKGLHGAHDWARREVEYTREIAEGVGYVQLMLGVEGSGTAWFDDVRVREVTEWEGAEPVAPADGEVVDVRRPLLTWTLPGPRMAEAEIRISKSQDVASSDATVRRAQGGAFRADVLEPGRWYWRLQAMSHNSKLPPGPVHTFVVPEDAPIWPPDIRPTWSWSDDPRPTLSAEVGPEGIEGELRIAVDGRLAAGVGWLDGTNVTFRPAEDLGPGVHGVTIRLRGPGGRIATETGVFCNRQPGSRVEVRDDNLLVVDGEPFFPIGAYRDPSDSLDDFVALTDAGFNVTHNYYFESEREPSVEKARAYLRAAHEAGLKVFMGARRSLVQSGGLPALQRWAAELAPEPALLTWYVMDEPVLHGVSARAMARVTEAIAQVDPFHPTSQVLCRPDAFDEYAPSCDILWNDPYPLPGRPLSMVDDWARAGRRAATDRPYWAVLQGHDVRYWRDYEQAVVELGPLTRPTAEETRCMAYTALCNGANGLIWYWLPNSAYHIQRDTPEVWEGIRATVRELKGLWPYLTARRTDSDAVSVPEPLRAWSRAAVGKRVLIVVNPSEEPAEADIALPELAPGTVRLIGPGGGKVEGEALRVALDPHAVEIHEWSRRQ